MADASQLVSSSASHVAQALTNPFALGVWLCDDAHAEQRPNGRIVLWWYEGGQMAGRWTQYESPTAFAWSLADDDGVRSAASFTLVEEGETTTITVAGDEIGAPWAQTLSDLAEYVETGVNRRELRRPLMGITFDSLDAEAAARRGAQIDGGVLISEASAGSGADAAGLTAGDVLESVGGTRVADWSDLVAALRGRSAGDTVPITYWRGGQRAACDVTLQGRPVPERLTDAALLAAEAAKDAAQRLTALREAFENASEEQAAHRPAQDAWSAKEVLSHVITSELWSRAGSLGAAFGIKSLEWSDPYDEMHRRRLQDSPVSEAIAAAEATIRDTAILYRDLLTHHATPPVIHRIAASLEYDRTHFDEHMNQVRKAISAGP